MKKRDAYKSGKRYRDKDNPLYPHVKESVAANILFAVLIAIICLVLFILIVNGQSGKVMYWS